MNNGFSFLKIVSGLSKTLNVANQLIPLYNQVKPMIANGSKILSTLNNKTSSPIKSSTSTPVISSNNFPTFFQ